MQMLSEVIESPGGVMKAVYVVLGCCTYISVALYSYISLAYRRDETRRGIRSEQLRAYIWIL